MSKTMFRTNAIKSAPAGDIDRDTGVIGGVTVVQMGEAKGHGVQLDSEFLDRVVELGNASRAGVKMRFGHPTMCSRSLGSFMGRQKYFAREGDKVVANAYLSNAAKDAPGDGNIYEWVFNIAETDPSAIAFSIAFDAGKLYKRDEAGEKVFEDSEQFDAIEGLPFIGIESLYSVDFVEEGAATDGLFSSQTVAGEVAQFLDDHPEVFKAFSESPDILKVLATHGGQVEDFFNRYKKYAVETITQTQNKEIPMAIDMQEASEETTAETDVIETESAETVTEQQGNETEGAETTTEEEETPEEIEADFQAYRRAIKEYGTELTEAYFDNGGISAIERAYFAKLAEDNKALAAQVKALSSGETATTFSEKTKPAQKGWFKIK